jgi:hypothetical protein
MAKQKRPPENLPLAGAFAVTRPELPEESGHAVRGLVAAVSARTAVRPLARREAVAAIDRLVETWLEGNLSSLATGRANGWEHLTLGALVGARAAAAAVAAVRRAAGAAIALRLAGRAAVGATAGFVREPLLSIECLLALGEHERGATITTGEGLITKQWDRSPEKNVGGGVDSNGLGKMLERG